MKTIFKLKNSSVKLGSPKEGNLLYIKGVDAAFEAEGNPTKISAKDLTLITDSIAINDKNLKAKEKKELLKDEKIINCLINSVVFSVNFNRQDVEKIIVQDSAETETEAVSEAETVSEE